jgi:ATP:ADP antiporter, AAA family
MTFIRRITVLLNLRPGEEALIGWLALLYFVLSLGFVFVQSMAFGIFLDEYGVGGLPYSYMLIAVLASAIAAVYIKLGGRLSFSKLLLVNLAFLSGVSLLIWLGLNSSLHHATAFILPLWFQITVNLGSLAVWSLAANIFDFRQGKRLFPLLSAGGWLGDVIGGLFIVSLVKFIGSVNLLILAVLSFGTAFFLMRFITRSFLRGSPEKSAPSGVSRRSKRSSGIFNNRYVLLIFAYIIVWWVAFFFVDNIFYNRAFARYPDADQLTGFIGQLVTWTGIVAVLSSTVITGRVIARFGLRAGLIAMPVAVTSIIALLALGGSLDIALFYIFALSTLAKLINVSFGFSLSQSANAIVYQSLPDTIRGRVQAMAEGILQPIAVGLAGISLLALTTGLKFTYIGLAFVLVGLGIAWLAIILRLSGRYVHALTQVIAKRRLGDSASVLADPASVALLQSRLQDLHAGIALYALTKLEALDPGVIPGELPGLVQHPAPEVRREAFIRIEKARLQTALVEVQNQLSVETVPAVREAALRALGAITNQPSQLTVMLHEKEPATLRGVLIGLLKYGTDPAAEQRLNELLVSDSIDDRALALEVIGEINRREFYPYILAACDSRTTSRAAGLALSSLGVEILPEIESAYMAADSPRQRLFTLSWVLGRIGGTDAQNILFCRISAPDHELRTHVLHALSQSGYRTGDLSAIQQALQVETSLAAWASAAQVDLGNREETKLLQAALAQFRFQICNRVLLLLALVIDGESMRHAREVFLAGSGSQLSYALEILDVQLPGEWKKLVMPLVEDLPVQERCQRLSALFPQAKLDLTTRLHEIRETVTLPDWIRACAAYSSHCLGYDIREGEKCMLSTVERVLVLKTVSMFSQTPDNVLADVADLLEEVDVAENETIFQKGDTGDSLYVILDGRVRVHDGERLLNYLGESDVFGEMALLDTAPRLASVTAVEATRLFRLEQASFYELMAERPEVATGIIRVLTRHLRNRVEDISRLDARIQELEKERSS